MAEVNTDYIHRNNSQLLKKHMEAMLNNKICSDTTFLVNKTQFYAWSHLVGMASKQLGMLLTTHYEEYGNRNIYIENVKSNESFLVILKYIYGVEINFTRTNVSHLCEVLSLAQTYELTEFYADIKYYLSTLNCFQLDMVVVLLNTSKQFDLLDLYKRLTMFVYQNADQLVKHTSFVELKFDVLMDLLKSDWFCASEIDILSGVINWQDNMSTRESNDEKTNDIEKQEFSGDNTSDVSCSGTDLSKLSLDDESEDEDDNLRSEKSDWEDSKELSYSEKNMDTGNIDPAETDRSTALVKSFSENVLKTLLSNVRVKQISAFDFMDALDSKLFKKHKRILANRANYSSNPEPRRAQQTDSSYPEPSGTQQTDSSYPEPSGTQQTDSSYPEPSGTQQTDSSYPEPSGTQQTDSSYPEPSGTQQTDSSYPEPSGTQQTDSSYPEPSGTQQTDSSYPEPSGTQQTDSSYPEPSGTQQNDSSEPRSAIEKVKEDIVSITVKNIEKHFVIKWNGFNRLYEAEEEYPIEGLNWKVCGMRESSYPCRYNIYLKCTSTEYKDWECTAQCELFWVRKSDAPLLLGSNRVTFNSHTPLVQCNDFRPYRAIYALRSHIIRVHFKSIQILGKK